MHLPWLSILIWLPIICGVLTIAARRSPMCVRILALISSMVCFVASIQMLIAFDSAQSGFQLVERLPWFEAFDIHYALGVDGFAVPLIVLTCFFTPLVILSAWKVIQKHVAEYMSAFLIMQGLICGVFAATDAILFYLFWEAMLIPMFLIIGIWGGDNRIYATIKFFLYTFLGSVLLLIALIYLHLRAREAGLTDTFEISTFSQLNLSINVQLYLFVAMFAAFAVKIPMWPVHTWLPDAHVQAPTGGSVVLAAIMLKLGAYGFLRFLLPITPGAAMQLDWLVILLSLIAIVYIGFVAVVQRDMKKLIAYSSIAHMGFATLGLFLVFRLADVADLDTAVMSVDGAYIQLISHGFISGALFLCIGVLYDRMHSRLVGDYGGVINRMPIFGALFVFFAMANAGLPGTSGFVGEFMVILSAFQAAPLYAFFAAMTLLLGAAYTLWMVKRVIFGPVANAQVEALEDISAREFICLGILAVCVLVVGVWPNPLLGLTHQASHDLVTQLVSAVR